MSRGTSAADGGGVPGGTARGGGEPDDPSVVRSGHRRGRAASSRPARPHPVTAGAGEGRASREPGSPPGEKVLPLSVVAAMMGGVTAQDLPLTPIVGRGEELDRLG